MGDAADDAERAAEREQEVEWEEEDGLWEDSAHFCGHCTCEHEDEEHGWGSCDVEGCPCEAGWEE